MVEELDYYLTSLKILVPQLNLNKPIYKEGTTIGQVTFHCTQAANYWIRTVILRQEFPRNRDLEFKEQPSLEQIQKSVNQALEACEELARTNLNLEEKLEKPVNVMPINFEAKTNLDALVHAIAHTAEHYGELFQTTR